MEHEVIPKINMSRYVGKIKLNKSAVAAVREARRELSKEQPYPDDINSL
jgi:hypothetical protein